MYVIFFRYFYNFRKNVADERILMTLSVALNVNTQAEEMDVDPASQASEKPSFSDKSEAIKEKTLGNNAYKSKDFETALRHYFKAIELDPTDITYYNNVAGKVTAFYF